MADLDLAELRRLAEAAREWAANGDPSTTAPLVALLDALPPSRVLQLLDRIDALEERLYGLETSIRGEADHVLDSDGRYSGAAVSRILRALLVVDDWADPGAVAGEPESTPAAEPYPARPPQPAEERLTDLMAELETSVREAKEARKRHPQPAPADTREARDA